MLFGHSEVEESGAFRVKFHWTSALGRANILLIPDTQNFQAVTFLLIHLINIFHLTPRSGGANFSLIYSIMLQNFTRSLIFGALDKIIEDHIHETNKIIVLTSSPWSKLLRVPQADFFNKGILILFVHMLQRMEGTHV